MKRLVNAYYSAGCSPPLNRMWNWWRGVRFFYPTQGRGEPGAYTNGPKIQGGEHTGLGANSCLFICLFTVLH